MRTVSTLIPEELYVWINENCEGNNISEKLRWWICSPIIHKERIEQKIKEMEGTIRMLKDSLNNPSISKIFAITDDMNVALIDAKKYILKNPDREGSILRGRCAGFNNKFNKNLSFREFQSMMEEVYKKEENNGAR